MKPTRKNLYHLLIGLAIIITIAVSIYVVVTGRRYFSNRTMRQIGVEIKAYGIWSPLIIFTLIILSTVIPPLPIPISFLEITAGIIFGFWPGFILIWVSQVTSALACFILSRKVGKIFAEQIAKSKIVSLYKQFIEKKRALAIFALRATMSAPFNISYFAGLIQMNGGEFATATAFGVIPEAVLFVYLGTLISAHIRFRLWYVFLACMALNYVPTAIIILTKYLRRNKKRV